MKMGPSCHPGGPVYSHIWLQLCSHPLHKVPQLQRWQSLSCPYLALSGNQFSGGGQ